MKLKLLKKFIFLILMSVFGIYMVAGQDTIPPTITISDSNIFANYREDDPDLYYTFLSNDTLEIYLSCLYSFPEEYYFKVENAIIEDESGIIQDTIIVDSIFFDDSGYGTIFQTIIAEDNSGNKSKFIIISKLGDVYDFYFLGMKVGDLQVYYDENNFALEESDFEFCNYENIEVEAIYSKNGCTGTTKINWYINDELIAFNSDGITIDSIKGADRIKVTAEAKFSNTGFEDRIPINIQKKNNKSYTVIHNPTCSGSADGEIFLDSDVYNVYWQHNGSNESDVYSLDTGTYYVSYSYDVCNFLDTITLEATNTFDFFVSDTVIDLNQNELLTITNNSNSSSEYLWQIGDSTFVNNENEFEYSFTAPGNYEIKLTDNDGICNNFIYKNILVEGTLPLEDTIPPKIIIEESQIVKNYLKGINGFDGEYSFLSEDKLEIILSCIYSFPEDYFFRLENTTINDESAIINDTIITNYIFDDDEGYGSISQTVVAEDIHGNKSEFEIITKVSDSKYRFDILGMNVGGIKVGYNESTFTLEQTDFEFCKVQNIDVVVLYSKNGCTGNTRIDWYLNNERVKVDSERISIDLSDEDDGIELASEAKYSNTNFQDRIKINIKKVFNQNIIEKYNPTCSNSADGIINLNPETINVKWEHNGSNALYLNSLNAGTYYVSYTYKECDFSDTINLIPNKILSFEVSDSIIDLSQSGKTSISNLSNNVEEFLWQIGDSTFVNNGNEFDYTFDSPGKYEIKLIDNSGFCNDTIVKDIIVKGTTSVHDKPVSSIKIGPNPFTDFLNIDLEKSADYEITILSVDGRVCLKKQIYDKGNFKLNLDFLHSGIYILNINSAENSEPFSDFKIVKLTDY